MKIFWFLILFFLTFSVNANTLTHLIGEWEQYDTGSELKYTYLKFNVDKSGIFATVRGDGEPDMNGFIASQVKIRDEIAEITFSESNEYKAKLLITGYEAIGNGIATGMLYMYIKKDEKWEIFNTIFIRLLKKNSNSFLLNLNRLQEGINK